MANFNLTFHRNLLLAALIFGLAPHVFSQNYCTSKGDFPWHEWIVGVRIGTQEKTSGKSQYSDFSGTVNFNLSVGPNATRLTAGFSYFTYDEYWRIWIDMNRDGDFEDAGEMFLDIVMPRKPDGTPSNFATANMDIPAQAQTLTTRMRVSMKRGSAPSPCETLPFGEVEDYGVTIASQGGCTKTIGTPADGAISCLQKSPTSNVQVLTKTGSAVNVFTLDADGGTISKTTSPVSGEDSVIIVGGNTVVRKTPAGAIVWQKTIPSNVLSQFPTIEAAVELNDGSFILGGFQRYFGSPGQVTDDSLVLVKTDNALNFQSFRVIRSDYGSRNYDKLLGFEKTQTGDAVAVFTKAQTFISLIFYRNFLKISPQLATIGEQYSIGYTGFQHWGKTPCGNYLFSISYNFPSIKSSRQGTTTMLFDMETMTLQALRTRETGSVSYAGSYESNSYFSVIGGQRVESYYEFWPYLQRTTPFNVKIFRADGSVFEMRPPQTDFDHIAVTGDNSILFVGTSGGQNWAQNPNCNSPGADLPDITLANMTLQNTAVSPGGVVKFNFDLKNIGNAPAVGDYIMTVYLSKDNQLGTSDLVAGYLNTGNTPVGTIPAVLGAITVPVEQPLGQYYIIIRADIGEHIVELREDNNVLAAPVPITISAGTAENCGFSTTVTTDGFSVYGAASLNGDHVFKMSKYDEPSNTTFIKYQTLNNDGAVTNTVNFSLTDKVLPLADDNFLCATLGEPNAIYLKKVNKAGTVLWVRQVLLSSAFDLKTISTSEASNGDILLCGVYRPSDRPADYRAVWYARADYYGQLLQVYYHFEPSSESVPVDAYFFRADGPNTYIIMEKFDPYGFGFRMHYLMKWSSQYTSPLFVKNFSGWERVRGVAEMPDGSILVTTYDVGPPFGSSWKMDARFLKLDASGNLIFARNYSELLPTPPMNSGYKPMATAPIMRSTDGGYITAFRRASQYGPGLPESFIVRLNANLDTVWTRRFAGDDLFKTFRAVPGGAFLGTLEPNYSNPPNINLMKIGAGGQIAPCAAPGTYCQSKGSFPWEDWIARVTMKNVDNSSGKSQYTDFTGKTVDLTAGSPTPVSLGAGFSYFTFDEYWKIWIDYNRNGVFEEADETALSAVQNRPPDGTPFAQLNSTAFIKGGFTQSFQTRMRIAMKRSAYPTPCETFAFGEVEDYTVNIVPGGGPGNQPDLTLANLTAMPASVQQGNAFNFNFDLKNIGTAAASGNFNVKSWLSTDNVLDGGDYQNGLVPTGNLAAGQTLPQVLGAMIVSQNVSPGNYFLILKVDADGQIAESDEGNNVLVSAGRITVTPGTGGGADLELTLTADKTTAPIYSNVTFTYTVKNTGNQAVANAEILTGVCGQPSGSGFGQPTQLVYAGTPAAPTVGSYNFVEQRWTISNLAPGQSGVLKITLFTLTNAERKVIVFSQSQSPADPDSQPGTMPANCQPTQDDEAVWTINAGQNLLEPGDRKDEIGNFEIGNFRIYPNPAGDQVFIVLKNWEGKPARLTLFNQLGVNVLEKNFEKISDAPEVLDLSGVPGGQYFLKMETAGERAVFGKLVVARMY